MNIRLVFIVFLILISAHALADDEEDCTNASDDVKLTACTRVIESGNWQGVDLSWAYNNRCFVWNSMGDYDRAIADCNEAISLDQQNAGAFINRGIAWRNKGDYDRAIPDCNEAIHLDPQYADAFYYRGNLWFNKGDFDRAIGDYNEAIRLNPKDADVFYNRGTAWYKKGDLDRAIAGYNDAIGLDPLNVNAFYNRGNAWSDKGDLDRAIADYNEVIRLDSQYVKAFNKRGNVLFNKGDYDKAIIDLNEAIRLDPHNAEAFSSRAYAQFAKGEFSTAASDFAEAQKLKPDIYSGIMLYLARAESGSDAREELTVNTNGMDSMKWPAPVVALFLGKAEPETIISQAFDPDPKTHQGQLCEANFYLGEWHLLRGNKQQAGELFTKARNDCPKTYYEYANSLAELGRIKK